MRKKHRAHKKTQRAHEYLLNILKDIKNEDNLKKFSDFLDVDEKETLYLYQRY